MGAIALLIAVIGIDAWDCFLQTILFDIALLLPIGFFQSGNLHQLNNCLNVNIQETLKLFGYYYLKM